MALWRTGNGILLLCVVLVVANRGAVAVDSFAATSGFEEFGNFGGPRGLYQFHGWLSNALDDNTGSQSQGFPAGYVHPRRDDDTFSDILPGHQEEPDLMPYLATQKSRAPVPEIHVKPNNISEKLSKKPTKKSSKKDISYVGKTYNVHEPSEPEELPKDYRYSATAKERTSTTESVYESMKLRQKQSKPSEQGPTQLTGGVYGPVTYLPSKYSTIPKQRANSKKEKHILGTKSPTMNDVDKPKPIQKLEMPVKIVNPFATYINEANAFYRAANNGGGFQPLVYIPQGQVEAAIFDTAKQQGTRANNNVIYVYPNPYQQTLAAIDPTFRRVIKLQPPTEHRKKYLSYKSTISTRVT